MNGVVRPSAATAAWLPGGRRLHLQHGPIDLVLGADGSAAEMRRAFNQARVAFEPILSDLVAELPRLRVIEGSGPNGTVARRMVAATRPFSPEFITPMAAVAGSVADHVLEAMCAGRKLVRAYVNNGGDIALHLTEGSYRIAICDNPATGSVGGSVEIRAEDGIGGVATSGWRGRSYSQGIADAVTVLARSAASADAAATMVANRVDLPSSPAVNRQPAQTLSAESDLGTRLVTTGVGSLSPAEARVALAGGRAAAEGYRSRGLLIAAYLGLAGEREAVPSPSTRPHIAKEAVYA